MPKDITSPQVEPAIDRLSLQTGSLRDSVMSAGADPTWLGCFWSAFADD